MSTDKSESQVRERIAEGLQDRLIDASEDLLAAVDYHMHVRYDRKQLFEAMRLVIEIEDLTEHLQQYKES
jgi:hypothetical protein